MIPFFENVLTVKFPYRSATGWLSPAMHESYHLTDIIRTAKKLGIVMACSTRVHGARDIDPSRSPGSAPAGMHKVCYTLVSMPSAVVDW